MSEAILAVYVDGVLRPMAEGDIIATAKDKKVASAATYEGLDNVLRYTGAKAITFNVPDPELNPGAEVTLMNHGTAKIQLKGHEVRSLEGDKIKSVPFVETETRSTMLRIVSDGAVWKATEV